MSDIDPLCYACGHERTAHNRTDGAKCSITHHLAGVAVHCPCPRYQEGPGR